VEFSEQQVSDFGVALNEATLIGIEVSAEERGVVVTLAVLALPPGGGASPEDPRVQILLQPVGRIVASLRDREGERVDRIDLDELESLAGSGQQPIYGWEFLDVAGEPQELKAPSLDWRSEPGGTSHTLDLFQEIPDLDVRIWFDELRIFDPDRVEIPFDEFTAAGVRWWDALYAGDSRTEGWGIVPGGAG
jgi:hypothetical protein